jgi:hypothetical protein
MGVRGLGLQFRANRKNITFSRPLTGKLRPKSGLDVIYVPYSRVGVWGSGFHFRARRQQLTMFKEFYLKAEAMLWP